MTQPPAGPPHDPYGVTPPGSGPGSGPLPPAAGQQRWDQQWGYGSQVTPYGTPPLGKVRGTGFGILLYVVTFGLYSLYWFYAVHDEMRRHKGTGLGGGIALLIAFFAGIAMPYLTSHEVGELYERRGQHKPVSWVTGLWSFPGVFILVGPIVWFVKTNGALNAYWRSLGAQG